MNTRTELEADLRLQASSPAQDSRIETGAQGSVERRPAQATAIGGQIATESGQGGEVAGDRVGKIGKMEGQASDDGISAGGGQSGQVAKLSPRAKGGQIASARGSRAGKKGGQPSANGARGGQIAQVIPLPSAHPDFRASVETLDSRAPEDEISGRRPAEGQWQATSWLKSLLPESQSGWWEVVVKGKGYAIKFRWRESGRQTLPFPQITGAQFVALEQCGPEAAARILHKRISANLHNFLLNPAKRGKALAVAAKLCIDLSVPPCTHSVMSKEM